MSITSAIQNMERHADQVLRGLAALRETGSYYGDGEILDTDPTTALNDLISVCRIDGFDQRDWTNVLEKRLGRGDLLAETAEAMCQMGRDLHFGSVLAVTIALGGHLPDGIRGQVHRAFEHALSVDERAEWKAVGRHWKEKAPSLTALLFCVAYWLDDSGAAERVMCRPWMKAGGTARDVDTVPRTWSRRNMNGLSFEFWRRYWLAASGERAFPEAERTRLLAHGLALFDEAPAFGIGIQDFFHMGHAHLLGQAQTASIRAVVEALLAIEPKLWGER